MANIESLRDDYEALDSRLAARAEGGVDPDCLLTFEYEYPNSDSEIVIDTREFTAVCPWNELPDFGLLKIEYVPDKQCIELKSLKYYLLSYRGVHMVQEHVANKVLNDLVVVCSPRRMTVTLDYLVRGGLHTVVTARHGAA